MTSESLLPNYRDMRLRLLSEIETACRECGDRYVDRGGQVQCRRPDCNIHGVRRMAQDINPAAFAYASV